jgi:hypothetical protein
MAGPGGIVLYEETGTFRPTEVQRAIRVHPLPALALLPARLPVAEIECVGLAGGDPRALVPALSERGVSRLCPPGRMQEPPLAWPRGQQAPLGTLLGRPGERRCAVDP